MDGSRISEAASKNRRGRPHVVSDEHIAGLRGIFPELATASKRTVQNRRFCMLAYAALTDQPDGSAKFGWLIGDPQSPGWNNNVRTSLLAELGRLGDKETIIEAATVLCRQKPAVKDAICRVRALRTGKKLKPDKVRLANILVDTVNDYMEATGCDWETALDAIDLMKQACEDAAGE